MRSSKTRPRSKNNRNNHNRSGANIMNRVFDSSGPEGKVRGTPQQIIEKYNQLVLILGGIAKQENYSELIELINEKVQSVVLIGDSSRVFSEQLSVPTLKIARSMEEAVGLSKSLAKGGAIVLSPACASFDMFDDFNDRGDQFKHHVSEGS